MKWKLKRIGDFCDTGSGGTPARSQASRYFDGTIPWVKSGELKEDVIFDTEEHINDLAIRESAAKMVPAGALLVALYGATVGRIATLGVDAATNQAVCYIVPKGELDRRFLFYALRTRVPQWLAQRVGGAQPNISQQIIKDTEIPLPSLSEQKRIAGILDQADGLRRKRQQALALTDQFLRSTFLDLFGDPVTNPKHWPVVPLASLVSADDSINYGVVQPGDEVADGIPIVRVGDFQDMAINTSNLKRIAPSIESQYKRSRLQGDEILIACVGSIGAVAIADDRMKGMNIVRAVARVRCGPQVNRRYLASLLVTSFIQSYFTNETRTVAQPTLNIKQIAETPIMLPAKDLQERFAGICSKCRAIRERIMEGQIAFNALFNSLVQRAFRGEL